MKKQYRLLKEKDFKSVIKFGKKLFSKFFTLYYKTNLSTENSVKIGIVIPKKKCKLSVRRNYFKRVIRSLFHSLGLEELPNVSCVIFLNVKVFSGDFCFSELKNDFILLNIKLMRKTSTNRT